MSKSLWQLLQEEPSNLTCDECFAVMEYYAEILAQGGQALLPKIRKHLESCPTCQLEHRLTLRRLMAEAEQSPASEEAAQAGSRTRPRGTRCTEKRP